MNIEDENSVDERLVTEFGKVPEYEIDPSVEALLALMKPKGNTKRYILLDDLDKDNKKILVKKEIELPIRKDYRNHINLYLDEETIVFMTRLKKSTIKILCYIMKNVEEYGNRVVINLGLVSRDLDMHYTTAYNARLELLKDGWIFKTGLRDTYTINLLRFSKNDIPHILNMYDMRKQRKELQEEINKQIELREIKE